MITFLEVERLEGDDCVYWYRVRVPHCYDYATVFGAGYCEYEFGICCYEGKTYLMDADGISCSEYRGGEPNPHGMSEQDYEELYERLLDETNKIIECQSL